MYLGDHARLTPSKAALINAATGRVTTYGELDRKSSQLAQVLHTLGLHAGDNVALFMENHPRFMDVLWAAMRSGLKVTTISRFLPQEEVARICNAAGIKALISSSALAPTAAGLSGKVPHCKIFLMAGGASAGWQSYETLVAAQPATSSGEDRAIQAMTAFGVDSDTVHLVTAPLCDAPFRRTALATQSNGGTIVMMQQFDPREALRLIERYHVTHGLWATEMFAALLALPEPIRLSYIMTGLRCAIHTGPPCPPETLQAMRDWWGPILHEYRED